jgi:hypothetical protein
VFPKIQLVVWPTMTPRPFYGCHESRENSNKVAKNCIARLNEHDIKDID